MPVHWMGRALPAALGSNYSGEEDSGFSGWEESGAESRRDPGQMSSE